MTSRSDDCTSHRRANPRHAEQAERAKTARPTPAQRQTQRPAAKRAPRLPAYVRHS